MKLRLASVLVLASCSKIDDVAFVEGEVPGTGVVTFSTSSEGEAYVTFGEPGSDLPRKTASFPASEGAVPVYGLVSGNPVELELHIDRGDKKELRRKVGEFTIAPPDLQVPPVVVNTWEPELACDPGGYALFGFLGADSSGLAIIDREGNYVWSYGSPDPKEQIARVRPSRDGKSLLWNYADVDKVDDIAHIVRMSLDGSERTETRTLSGHHDFVELPDGKMGFLSYEFRTMWAVPQDEGPVVTASAELGCIFGEHPWQSAGDDLSVKDSDKASVEIVLNFEDTDGNGELEREYITLSRGTDDIATSGSFELDTTALPWTITLTQTQPEPATLEGLIEVHDTMLKLEVVQTSPDLGLTPPTREAGLGSSAGGGLSPGDNVLTFRREVSVAADAIYEVPEGTTETGGEYIVWSAFEDYPQGIYRLPEEGFQCAFLPESFEFGHANSLGYVESTTSYFMMWRWLDTLLQVSRGGELVWQWGGPYSDLTGNPDELFYHAHFSEVWDGGMLMFDNRTRDDKSRLVEYTFDDTSFQQVWEYQEPEPKFEAILGDVRRIPIEGCDNLLVSWSGQGKLQELTPDGTVVWEVASTSLSGPLGRVYFLPSLEEGGGLYDLPSP
jgi:hypothetical protein